ncbi:MAG: M1 family metallopeptidase [Verrucomicrobia bacterium]|nr:M1 family metallopeptidase [Verrucomicrobiota bacterium]
MRLIVLLTDMALPLAAAAEQTPGQTGEIRPKYVIEAQVDADGHKIGAVSTVTIPASEADPLTDTRFVLYANAIRGIGRDGKAPIAIRAVRLGGQAARWRADGTDLTVTLPERKTQPFDLTIEFTADPPRIRKMAVEDDDAGDDDPNDSKCENFGIFGYDDDVLSLGSFWYPQLMVRNGGGWVGFRKPGPGDLLHAQASDFTVSFGGLPKDVTVVATGTGDGRKFHADGARDFAVLMSRDFVSETTEVMLGKKAVRVHGYVNRASKRYLPDTLEIAVNALKIFHQRFGAYPFDTLKVVEAPLCGNSGGMEYSGVASLRSGYFGVLSETAREEGDEDERRERREWTRRMMFELPLVHEIAHQWWAIGVGNDSLRHPFVDEALATWSSMLYFEDRYGAERAGEISDMCLKNPLLFSMEQGTEDAPANRPTSDYDGMDQYGMVVYQKGALFYTELRKRIGDEAFFGGLRDYYGRFRFRLAGPDDLREIFLASKPELRAEISTLYQKWIFEANGIGDNQKEHDESGEAPSIPSTGNKQP